MEVSSRLANRRIEGAYHSNNSDRSPVPSLRHSTDYMRVLYHAAHAVRRRLPYSAASPTNDHGRMGLPGRANLTTENPTRGNFAIEILIGRDPNQEVVYTVSYSVRARRDRIETMTRPWRRAFRSALCLTSAVFPLSCGWPAGT